MNTLERYRGCLLGLAVGDALGTTLEFASPGTFTPLTDMVGGGPFNLLAGQWTDDTSMALCLAESLIECKGYNVRDQMERYCRWYRDGHLSSTGQCFDIGNITRAALIRFERTLEPYSGPVDRESAGNGSIMRLAPIPMAFACDPKLALEHAGDSSRTTHGTDMAIDGCRYLGALLVGALRGESKEVLMQPHFSPLSGYWQNFPLVPEINEIASGSFTRRQPPEISGTGFVVKSLEAALWAFHQSRSFEHGCLLAVNLGADADTTGAVYGQIAGAYYGVAGIPEHWLERLSHRQLIEEMADKLHLMGISAASISL